MIVFSDLHLRDKSADTVLGEVFPGLRNALRGDNEKLLVCLGDFYHIRYKVDVYLQNRVTEYFNDLSTDDVNIILLPGNHDQIDEKGENALEVFSDLENVTVFSKPSYNEYGVWLPYRKDPIELISALKRYIKLKARGQITYDPVVWVHHGIRGAWMNNTLSDTSGIDPIYFRNFTVFSGHYHRNHKIGENIYYIGSPYQIDLGEANQEKYFAVWNPGKKKVSFVRVAWGSRYYNCTDVHASFNPEELKEGDIVRFKAPVGVDLEEFRKSLDVPDHIRCIVEPTLENNQQRLDVGHNPSFYDYLLGYVESFKGNLNQDELIRVYNELCE